MKNDRKSRTVWLKDRLITPSNIFFALSLITLCLLSIAESYAKDYTFTWSANPEPVEGYRLYYKKGGGAIATFDGTNATEGDSPINVGKHTSYTITGLEDNTLYYFALTAYNGKDESAYSTIITIPSATQLPSNSPKILNIILK